MVFHQSRTMRRAGESRKGDTRNGERKVQVTRVKSDKRSYKLTPSEVKE